MVENEIMALHKFEVARRYIIYRYVQNLKRQSNTTDDKILSLIECNNEEVKQEILTRTQRLTPFNVTIWQAKSPKT